MSDSVPFSQKLTAIGVPLLDLKPQYQALESEIVPVLAAICSSQQFILGRYVMQFEKAAAAYCRSREAPTRCYWR
jgi:dTDP-4-amino-4,6-dideoxygalactose transaminase